MHLVVGTLRVPSVPKGIDLAATALAAVLLPQPPHFSGDALSRK